MILGGGKIPYYATTKIAGGPNAPRPPAPPVLRRECLISLLYQHYCKKIIKTFYLQFITISSLKKMVNYDAFAQGRLIVSFIYH